MHKSKLPNKSKLNSKTASKARPLSRAAKAKIRKKGVWGCMAGTITVAFGTDLTAPALDPECFGQSRLHD
jgi:hypothetical protein